MISPRIWSVDNLIVGDALQEIRRIARYGIQDVDCTVTSPPYLGLRDYRGEVGQVGHGSVQEYLSYMGELAYILRTITAKDGTAWVNVGDTYNAYNHNRGAGTSFSSRRHDDRMNAPRGLTDPRLPNKSMLGIPWRVALEFQSHGWILRNEIIWRKTSPPPERVSDRFVRAHEHVFLFSRSDRYHWNMGAIQSEGDRIPLDVWDMPTGRVRGHSAPFPLELPERCITASCKPGGLVFDPFTGSGTTWLAAKNLDRRFLGIELSAEYADLARSRAQPNKEIHP